jgi:hypothetical protein
MVFFRSTLQLRFPITSFSVGNESNRFVTDRTEQGFGSSLIRDLPLVRHKAIREPMIFERK